MRANQPEDIMRNIAEHWVIELLLRHKRARTNIQLAVESGRTLRAINSACCRLVDSGAIVRVKPVMYVLAAGCETPEQCEPLFDTEQPVADIEIASPTTIPALCVADLQTFDGEPRGRDLRLAERAQLAKPRNIREVIINNYNELLRYGSMPVRRASPEHGGHEVKEYWLNEGQS